MLYLFKFLEDETDDFLDIPSTTTLSSAFTTGSTTTITVASNTGKRDTLY